MEAAQAPFGAKDLIKLGRVQAIAPSPCGRWLAVEVARLDSKGASYISDLWRVSLVGEHEPVQLTRGETQDGSPAFRHDGALAFLSDRATGGEDDEDHARRRQVFLFDPRGGEPVCVTDEPLGVQSFGYARGADVLVTIASVLSGVAHEAQRRTARERRERGPSAISYTAMPARYWDHWIPEAAPHLVVYRDGERMDLTPDAQREHRHADWAVSPDGQRVAIVRSTPNVTDRLEDHVVEVYDTLTGERLCVLEDVTTRAGYGGLVFSPDGGRLAGSRYARQDGRHGDEGVWVADLRGARRVELVPYALDAGLTPAAWTPDGARLIASADWQGHVPAFALDVATGEVERLTDVDAGGTHVDLHVVARGDDLSLVGVRSTLRRPPEPFIAPLQAEATPRTLTNLSGFKAQAFADRVQIEDLRVTSTDGAQVQAFVMSPPVAEDSPRQDYPLLMWIHGGPIGQWGDGWHWRWCPLVGAAEGYIMTLPNPRGSTGFGYDYINGIWGNQWGGQCYEDLMRLTDALAALPHVDADRMAAMGGSFGGYMTAWIGAQTDRFRCLVDHAGVTSFHSFYGVTDLPAWWRHMVGLDPFKAPEAMRTYSPLAHISGWRSPTLIIHGQQDYRVPVGEALYLFEALQHHGVQSELLIFPDENHWILKPRNIVAWYDRALGFIRQHTSA